MDDEHRVAQRLRVLRDLGFIKFIGQRRIKEVQPLTPPSPLRVNGRSHPFQPKLVVDSVSEFLLAAQVSFGRLN